MAWNEPGSGKRDPWRDGGGGGGGNGGGTPPDLDAFFRRIRNFFSRLTGGGSGGGGGIGIAVVGVLIAWLLLDSWALIDARQHGAVLRFGEYSRAMTPGLNFKWPRPIESVEKVDATIRSISDQVRMLTRDENIVQAEFNVQYEVSDARRYLFNVDKPDETLKQAAESAVREVIGSSNLNSIMPDQVVEVEGEPTPANPSAELANQVKRILQQTLDRYEAGLEVTELNFQNVRPPQEVKDAFDDAISAREDRQRSSNLADADAKRLVPEARGEAARILAEAAGYKAERVAKAQGDADRFRLIAEEYRAAPEVTRRRLYIETLQQVLGESNKVVDFTDGKNVFYLPAPGATAAQPQAQPDPMPSVMATPQASKGGR